MIDDLHSILLKNVSQARAAVEAVQVVVVSSFGL